MTVTEEIDLKLQKEIEAIQKFCLMNDTYMSKFFDGHPECIELVLQIIMEKPDLKVLDVRTQVFGENLVNRSVRLDVLATDSTGAKYNIEVQRSDKGAGFRRARYNSSMMDVHLLPKGDDFEKLPETYVIFITENDVIGKGEALYPIGRCFLKTGEVFDDGTHIVYVNGSYRGNSPIGKLMEDFFCRKPDEMHYKVLADRSKYLKQEKEGVQDMCKVMEELMAEREKEIIKETAKKTAQEKANEMAKKMLKDGKLSLETIADYSGLTVEEVKELTLQLV